MQTTTITLNPEVHAALRHLAVDERTTFRELIRQAIEEFLARRGKK
jgi:predicted transcriptional regulator